LIWPSPKRARIKAVIELPQSKSQRGLAAAQVVEITHTHSRRASLENGASETLSDQILSFISIHRDMPVRAD
jgi:hypothetical protein